MAKELTRKERAKLQRWLIDRAFDRHKQREKRLKEHDVTVIDGGKRRYDEGDKYALLETIFYCNSREIPLPKWVDEKLLEAKALLETGKLESWEQFFGELPTGPAKKGFYTRSRATEVWIAVQQLHRQDPKKYPLDESTFEKVGIKLKLDVRASRVKDLYYLVDKFYGHRAR